MLGPDQAAGAKRRCEMYKLLRSAVAAGVCAGLTASAFAQTTKEEKKSAYLSPEGKAIAAEKNDAPGEYQKAVDAITTGNEAKKKGDDASAYCLYGEAIYMLNDITEKYPEWNKDVVAKQLKNIMDVSQKLNAVTCKNLELMKEADFRLSAWQNQARALDKLDRIIKRLDELERIYWDKDDRYIKDIRDLLFKRLDK